MHSYIYLTNRYQQENFHNKQHTQFHQTYELVEQSFIPVMSNQGGNGNNQQTDAGEGSSTG